MQPHRHRASRPLPRRRRRLRAHGQHPHSFWKSLQEELPFGLGLVVFLTACTVFLHGLAIPQLDRMEHAFVSQVMPRAMALRAASNAGAQDPRAGASGTPRAEFRIQHIELSGELRALAIEEPEPDAATIRRLDGVRPLSRGAMATLLSQLADCLGSDELCPSTRADREQRPQVLMLDVDLAPLRPCADGAAASECRQVLDALASLRKYVHVVLIALKRPEREANDIVARFLRESECTREGATASAGPAGSPGRKGLYFASPLLFERGHQGPLKFPAALAHGAHDRWFPGLGTLAWTASQPPGKEPPERIKALTWLCEAAHESTAALERALQGQKDLREQFSESDFGWRYLNWLAMEDEQAMEFTPVSLPIGPDAPAAGNCRTQDARKECLDHFGQTLRKFGLGGTTLLLSVDAGGTTDKFTSPGLRPDPISGATVHAVQALSVGRDLTEAGWVGIAADLLLGAVMMLLLAIAKLAILEGLRHRLPYSGALASTATVLGVTYVMSLVALESSARLMVCGYWFNPLFVIIGLALHGLVEGWLPQAQGNADSLWARWDDRVLKTCLLLALLAAALTVLHHH